MAFLTQEECLKCEQLTTHINSKCSVCADRIKRQQVEKWNALTTDEKLNDLRKRIEILERGEVKF